MECEEKDGEDRMRYEIEFTDDIEFKNMCVVEEVLSDMGFEIEWKKGRMFIDLVSQDTRLEQVLNEYVTMNYLKGFTGI